MLLRGTSHIDLLQNCYDTCYFFLKFTDVIVIRIYSRIVMWGLFLYFTYIMSVVIIKNEKQNTEYKRKMCQRKTESGTQILVSLKRSLIHVHLSNHSMVI